VTTARLVATPTVPVKVVAPLPLVLTISVSAPAVAPSTDEDWVRIIAIALFPGAGHLLLNFAQNKAPLNLMGVIQLIVPVNATLMAYWFLDQNVTAVQLLGMAVVMSALTVQTVFRRQPPVVPDEGAILDR